MRNWLLVIVIVTAFGHVACSNDEEPGPAASAPGPAPAKVETETIAKTSLVERRSFLGEVRNASSAVLAAGGSGSVLKIDVLEGDEVKRGQVLVQLDDGILRARLGESRAQLTGVEAELDQVRRDETRFTALSEQGHFPPAQAEQIASRRAELEAALTGQKAAIQRLREEIAQMKIVAPIDGMIAQRHVAEGQWLQTGQPALELASDGVAEIHVRVPAEVLDKLPEQANVTIERGEQQVAGVLAGVVGSLDPRTRTALLRVVPQEPKPWLREGAALSVTIELPRSGEGVIVSSDAIVYGVAGTRVFRVKEGKAEPLPVTIVAQEGEEVLVASENLSLGDEIVSRGNERLRPGQDLEVAQ